MKKLVGLILVGAFMFCRVGFAVNVGDDMNFEGDVTIGGALYPSSGEVAGYQLTTNGSGTLSWAAAGGAGSTAWDDIGSPDANKTHAFTTYTTIFTGTSTASDQWTFKGTGNFGDVSVVRIESSTGNPTDGTVLEVVSHDANVDPLVVSADGLANAFVVGQGTGVVTLAGIAEGTSALVLTAGDLTLTDGDLIVDGGDVRFNEDVTVKGVVTLDNGLTLDNSSNNVFTWNENSEEIKWTFGNNALDLSSTSGVNTLEFFDNAAAILTHSADAGAEDLTISQTGTQDASLVLSSAGTGADALQINTSAGGIDITVTGGAAGEDIDITTDSSINLATTENAGSAITAITNGGTSETIVITNTQGTGDSAIDINGTAGGLDVDVAKSLTLTSSENTADSVVITSSAGGIDILASAASAGEDIDITATGSSVNITATEASADALVFNASTAAGGIDITSNADIDITTTGAAGEDISITNTGGSIAILATENAADAITVTTNGGTTEQMVFTNTLGTNDAAIDVNCSAGGFDLDAVKSVAIGSSENTADAIQIAASAGGIDITATGAAGEDLDLVCTAGSANLSGGEAAADAVVISAGAGGVDISSAATYDIDITATGGTVQVIASEAAANQFKVDAQGTVAGYAIVLETTDGGVQINSDGAANGDISVDAGDDLTLTSAGDTTFAVTGTLSMGKAKVTNALMDYEAVTAANVIAATEGNKIFFIGSATEFASTLPTAATSAGVVIEFYVTAAPSGASYTIVTTGSENTIIGGCSEREVDTGDDGPYLAAADTVTIVDSLGAVGDYLRFVCDGTNWYMTGQVNKDGAVTITQAS